MEKIEEAGDRRKRAEKLLYIILSKNAESNFITALRQSEYRGLADHLTSRKGDYFFKGNIVLIFILFSYNILISINLPSNNSVVIMNNMFFWK